MFVRTDGSAPIARDPREAFRRARGKELSFVPSSFVVSTQEEAGGGGARAGSRTAAGPAAAAAGAA
jgi:hypothetical protein